MEVQYALTVLGGGDVAQLNEIDRLFLEESADVSAAYEFKPTRLKLASGGAKMFVDSDDNSVPAPLKGYVIDAVRTRAFWPEKEGNKIPFCSSLGAVMGVVNPAYTDADLRGAAQALNPHPAVIALDAGREIAPHYDCASCPMAQFGSAYQGGEGGGQACKAKVLFLFLPEGWSQPCLLSVPTTSIKNWFQYASGIKQRSGREFFTFKTQITVDKKENKAGTSYGVLKFESLGPIQDMDTAQAVLVCRRELKQYLYNRDIAINGDEEDVVETTGRLVDPDTGEVLN